jgi:hypothetical protein
MATPAEGHRQKREVRIAFAALLPALYCLTANDWHFLSIVAPAPLLK